MEEIIEEAKKLDPATREGFVVCDQHFNRVKVKSPLYVAVSLLYRKDTKKTNAKRMLEVYKLPENNFKFIKYRK